MANKVIRRGKFDAGHRVMHERFKCFNLHGHEYHYELEFEYLSTEQIGYAIDFKEIKRVACQWIDDTLDHGFIANPQDSVIVQACLEIKSKLYLMHLVDVHGYCNPSAENVAKEMFFAVSVLLNCETLTLVRVKLHETVNCYVECDGLSKAELHQLFNSTLFIDVNNYGLAKGKIEYDERKVTAH